MDAGSFDGAGRRRLRCLTTARLGLAALRLRNEEEVLLRDFPGYEEYMKRIPCRLIPGVW